MNAASLKHWLLPGLCLIVASFVLELHDGDLWLAQQLFRWQGSAWQLKQHWLLEDVLHRGGRQLVSVLVLALVCLYLNAKLFEPLRRYRFGLGTLLVAVITSLIAVSALKAITHINCPWNLSIFGGSEAYRTIFSGGTSDSGRCFPAGHASGGYAWLGLYFFVRRYWPRWRLQALLPGLLLGLVFGLAQQLRGAHFLSHDIYTLIICWYCALLVETCATMRIKAKTDSLENITSADTA